jgi:hypothetical protein
MQRTFTAAARQVFFSRHAAADQRDREAIRRDLGERRGEADSTVA